VVKPPTDIPENGNASLINLQEEEETTMLNVTKDTITDHVIAALAKDIPDRNRQIMTSLIRHMHAFCKEVDLTFAEWFAACEFLRRAGDISDEKRNEFILIADILGVEVLVDMLDHRVTDGESESTVLGPFYRENPPVLPKGASIIKKTFDNADCQGQRAHQRHRRAADRGRHYRRLGRRAERALRSAGSGAAGLQSARPVHHRRQRRIRVRGAPPRALSDPL